MARTQTSRSVMKHVVSTFDTVADMKAAVLEVGRVYRTLGYTAKADGGGADYLITTGSSDPYIIHSVNEGSNIAKPINLSPFNVKMAGAKGDDIEDDTLAIQAAIDYSKLIAEEIIPGKIVTVTEALKVPSGQYKHTSLIMYTGVRMTGDGISSTLLKFIGTSGNAINLSRTGTEELFGTQLEALSLINEGTGSHRGVSGDDGVSLAIRKCHIKNCMLYGFDVNLYLNSSYTFQIDNSILAAATSHNAVLKNITAGGAYHTRFDVSGDNNVEIYDDSSGNETIVATFFKCTFQSSTKWGLYGEDIVACRVLDCFFEANNQDAVSSYGSLYFADGSNNRGKHYEIKGCFFTPGSGTSGQTGMKIDRAEFIETSNMIRGSGISTGIDLGVNVEYCIDKNIYDGQTTNINYDETTTKILMFNALANAPAFWSDGVTTSSFDAADAALGIGQRAGGQVLLGAFDNIGGIQGVGTGSDFKLKLNPYQGDVEICLGTGNQIQLGGTRRAVSLTGSNRNSTGSDNIIGISTAGGNRQYALFSADVASGRIVTVKKTTGDANLLNIVTQGSETIDGAASLSTSDAYASFTLFSDGVNWFTI